jgi:toxin-antitoxin system PIN domain toxin
LAPTADSRIATAVQIVDANVLLYAVNRSSRHHSEAREWLDRSLSGGSAVGFPWLVLLAFVRLSTNARVFAQPLSINEATSLLDDWLATSAARVVAPTARHLAIFTELLTETGTGANLVNDAHLAALAIEHRASIITYDTDFARFARVSWSSPEATGG